MRQINWACSMLQQSKVEFTPWYPNAKIEPTQALSFHVAPLCCSTCYVFINIRVFVHFAAPFLSGISVCYHTRLSAEFCVVYMAFRIYTHTNLVQSFLGFLHSSASVLILTNSCFATLGKIYSFQSQDHSLELYNYTIKQT